MLNDTDLIPFQSTNMAKNAFETACQLKKETSKESSSKESSWADHFSAVEVIRKIALHHSDVLVTSDLIDTVIDSAVEAATSLRSSTIRNGILLMRSLVLLNIDQTHIIRIIEVLMSRTASCPKFICDIAINTLDEIIPR